MKVTKRQLRQIIREAILLEQAVPVGQSVKSTHPESTKIYAVRYPDARVGAYAGHDSKGANDPEAKSAAKKTGVELKPGKRGRGFEAIGNKHSPSEFDKEYRLATRSIRDEIERMIGDRDIYSELRAARDLPGDWRKRESKARRDYYAGKLKEPPAIVLDDAATNAQLDQTPPPDLNYAKKLSDDGTIPR